MLGALNQLGRLAGSLPAEPSDLGTDEYLRFCHRTGAQPSITVNVEGRGATAEEAAASWSRTFGLVTPPGFMAMHARRYMYESGATSEDFGAVFSGSATDVNTGPLLVLIALAYWPAGSLASSRRSPSSSPR